jgi:peptide/nickel transport system substrate-binding protein
MKRLAVLFCCVLMLFGMTASAQNSNPDVLVWSLVGGDISTLNSALSTDGNSGTVITALFDGLFKVNPDTAQPEPDLATWKVSDDGLTYTFTMNDAKWSDGTPITSKDAKFTYDAIVSDKVQSPRKSDMTAIKSVTAPDDKTLVITLNAPTCTIWGNGFSSIIPLPSEKFKADFSDFMTNDFNLNPTVTSGPYQFDERKAGEYVRLKANPNYFGGAPKIPGLLFNIIADSTTLNQALQTNTIDYAFMYPDQLDQLQQQDRFNTFLYPNANAPIVVMNYQDPDHAQNAYDDKGNPNKLVPNKFFSDIRVRQAVAMGYNKEDVAKTLGENAGSEPLSGPIVPSFYKAYDMSSVKPWEYNPDKAKELLAEAGWTDSDGDGILDKDGVKFEVDLIYSKLVDLWGNAALIMQDQLGQIGIKINIVEQEWSAYLSNVLLPGKFNLSIVGFGGGTEVDGIGYNLLYSKNVILGGGGFNISGYVNPKMDALLDQARTVPGCGVADREKLYTQIQQIAHDDVPYDWLVSTTQVNVLNKRVLNANIGQWDGGAIPHGIIGWSLGQ